MPLHAVVDEKGLQLSHERKSDINILLKTMATLLDRLDIDKIERWKDENIYEVLIFPEEPLWALLYQNNGIIDKDIAKLLKEQLDRIKDWQSHQDERTGETLSSQEFASLLTESGEPCACIIFPPLPEAGAIPFIANEKDVINFYREAPELGNFREEAFIANAARAFPSLCFKPGIEYEFNRFSKKYDVIRKSVTDALSALNDHLPELQRQYNGKELANRFSAQTNYEISPESSNTHKNMKAMQQRTITFSGKSVRCEWHLKITPQIDRIHFYFGSLHPCGEDKILVGIFSDHLDT